MSSWHKPDPSDELWPPDLLESPRESEVSSMAVYAVWQKLLRGIPLSPLDEAVLGMSEQERKRLAEVERNRLLEKWAEEKRVKSFRVRCLTLLERCQKLFDMLFVRRLPRQSGRR